MRFGRHPVHYLFEDNSVLQSTWVDSELTLHGRGWTLIGLQRATLTAAMEERLCAGFHPWTGEPMLRNAGAKNAYPGTMFIFPDPKVLSITLDSLPIGERNRALASKREKCNRSLEFYADHFATRLNAGGAIKAPAFGLLMSLGHGGAANGDSHHHDHVVAFNVTVEKTTGVLRSLDPDRIVALMKCYDAERFAIAVEMLRHDCGRSIRVKNGRIVEHDIPAALLTLSSTTSEIIKQRIRERGLSDTYGTRENIRKELRREPRDPLKDKTTHLLRVHLLAQKHGFFPRLVERTRTNGNRELCELNRVVKKLTREHGTWDSLAVRTAMFKRASEKDLRWTNVIAALDILKRQPELFEVKRIVARSKLQEPQLQYQGRWLARIWERTLRSGAVQGLSSENGFVPVIGNGLISRVANTVADLGYRLKHDIHRVSSVKWFTRQLQPGGWIEGHKYAIRSGMSGGLKRMEQHYRYFRRPRISLSKNSVIIIEEFYRQPVNEVSALLAASAKAKAKVIICAESPPAPILRALTRACVPGGFIVDRPKNQDRQRDDQREERR